LRPGILLQLEQRKLPPLRRARRLPLLTAQFAKLFFLRRPIPCTLFLRRAYGRAPKGKSARPFSSPGDRLTGQPQEGQYSAAVLGGTRDRLPPAGGAEYLARGDRHPNGPRRLGARGAQRIEPVWQSRMRRTCMIPV
jgi:hypothetical protein